MSEQKFTLSGRTFLKEWQALLSPEMNQAQFMARVIQVQCRAAGADGGVWLQSGTKGRVDIMAAHPPLTQPGKCDSWVGVAAQVFARQVMSTQQTIVTDESGSDPPPGSPGPWIVVVPVKTGEAAAAAAFILSSDASDRLLICCNTLEMTPLLIQYRALQQTLGQKETNLRQVCTSLDILSAFHQSHRFLNAANVLCNEMAARWQCSRVSIGFLKNRYIRVTAMSHTHEFNRKMRLVQDLEMVMEECLDQDLEIVYPGKGHPVCVNRAAGQFSTDHGPVSLLSLPLRHHTGVQAIMTLERQKDQKFTPAEIETARLTADLFTQRLMELYKNNRWFTRPLMPLFKTNGTRIQPPRHILAKCLAALGCCLLIFLFTAKADYRVKAPFTFTATLQQVVVAPFDSYIKTVSVEAGDQVIAGKTILGRLDVSEPRLELAALKAERIGYQKKNAAALRDRKTAESHIALAQIDKVTARIRMLEERIKQGVLTAPITGLVVSKDLKQQIGAPVTTGTILFEVAAVNALRAELYVPEDSISDIQNDQTGDLMAVGHPNQKIAFIVERISPVADVVNQRNIFRVKVRLEKRHEWMRPGMEGLAKITVGKASYAWLASRRVINWLRMVLWI